MLRSLKLLARLGRRQFRKLDVSVTNSCNLFCQSCSIWSIYRDNPSQRRAELTVPEYRAFFQRFNYWNQISFTGGEPTIRKDLQEIIDAAIQSCPALSAVGLDSNGSAPGRLVDVVGTTLERHRGIAMHVAVSLDGPEDLHDTLRGRKGSWRQVIDAYDQLRALKHRRLDLHLQYTISNRNRGGLRELLEGGRVDPRVLIVSIAHESYRYGAQNESPVLDLEAAREEVRYFLSQLRIRSLQDLGQWVFLRHFLTGRRIPCVAGRTTFHMDPYGLIHRCTLIPEKRGSARELALEEDTPPRDCHCYTPCESYFGIAQTKARSLFQALRG